MRTNRVSRALFMSVVLAVASAAPGTVGAATLTVTDCGDSGGPGQLRTLIGAAASGDTIVVPGCTIFLAGSELTLNKGLTIQGAGRDVTVVDGGGVSRVFNVACGGGVTIAGITIRNGRSTEGGGIRNTGTLTLTNAAVTGNFSTGSGGGIQMIFAGGGCFPTLTLTNVVVDRNVAAALGGGIENINGTLTLTNVVIADNLAGVSGGGVKGTMTFTNGAVSGNRAGRDGGGIVTGSNSRFTNVTVSGNMAGTTDTRGRGGGISAASAITVTNSTISGNSAPPGNGGGIAAPVQTLPPFVLVVNTIIANSPSGGNCTGTIVSEGHSISGDATCGFTGPGDRNNVNPLLGPLADNGGGTLTHALLPGSPAIDAGDNLRCPATDQRGIPRPQNGVCDIGAFEVVFADVPANYWARPWIEALYAAGVTGGCGTSPSIYCPEAPVTREQMAVFLLKAKQGAGYAPPACLTPTFGDVPCSSAFAPWIEELVRQGVTAGCGAGNYCPGSPVTREQMAVFLLKALEGPAYAPPACTTPSFADVPCSSPFAPWVEELAARGITAGCTPALYCPSSSVSRAQMAVFLVKTFDLPL